jgi:hypothetical protein
MANKGYILYRLDPHDSCKLTPIEIGPEVNPFIHLVKQLLTGHVGDLPPVRRDYASINLCRLIDNNIDGFKILFLALPYHGF